MHLNGGAVALALLSALSPVFGQVSSNIELDQDCDHLATWYQCQGQTDQRLHCASILVPRDWTNPRGSDQILLRLIRYAAANSISTANQFPSIITNPGGPGASGIMFILNGGAEYFRVAGSQYNIIGFDSRGVGQTQAYSCPTVQGISPGGFDYLAQDFYTDAAAYATAQAEVCSTAAPDNFGNLLGTIQVAKDVRAIAKATQATVNPDNLLRFWGGSYGTLLGNTIARIFPDDIGGMVLDGNVDPNEHYFGVGVNDATDTDKAFFFFFELCELAGAAGCPFQAAAGQAHTQDNLLARFNSVVGQFQLTPPSRGRTNTTFTNTQAAQVRSMLFSALYSPSNYHKAAAILEYWFQDSSRVATIEDVDTYNLPGYTPPTFTKRQTTDGNFTPSTAFGTLRALSAISCVDSELRPGASAAGFETIYTDFLKKSGYGGDLIAGGPTTCVAWLNKPPETWQNDKWPGSNAAGGIKTKRGILFLQTRADPITPAVNAVNAMSYYQGASLIYTNGFGHCTSGHLSNTLNEQITAYWTSKDYMPPNGYEYLVQNFNPFTSDPQAGRPVLFLKEPVPVPGTETVQMTKRDASLLFEGLPIPKRHAGFPRTPSVLRRQLGGVSDNVDDEYIVCGPEDSNNVTTSATSSSSTAFTSFLTTTSAGTNAVNPGSRTVTAMTGVTTMVVQTTMMPPATMTYKPTWNPWNNQKDCYPVTKIVCAYDGSQCDTTVYAVPTRTVYTDYVDDVCETGLTKKPITVTATCNKGCESKPTGVPQGYHTTKVWCAKCEQPSSVLVTQKNPAGWVDAAAPTDGAAWSDSDKPANWDDSNGHWSDAGKASPPSKPANWDDSKGNWADSPAAPAGASGKPAGWDDSKGDWADASKASAAPAASGKPAGWDDSKGNWADSPAGPAAPAASSKPAGWDDSKGNWADASTPAPAAASASGKPAGWNDADGNWADAGKGGKVGDYKGAAARGGVAMGLVGVVAGLWLL